MAEIRVTRAYFDATPNSADEAVAAELPRHPVFRLSFPPRWEDRQDAVR